VNSDWDANSEISSTEELSKEKKIPEGKTYLLNSKWLAVTGGGESSGLTDRSIE